MKGNSNVNLDPPNTGEYKFLRTEILQYLEEYQTVRNMMYCVTAAVLGINGNTSGSPYIFLLPLLVILPSYIIFYDYWRDIVRAAKYLEIFYEGERQFPYHWETRLGKFSHKCKTKRIIGVRAQQLPFIVCGIVCIVIFFCCNGIFMIDGNEISIHLDTLEERIPLYVGLTSLIISVLVYYRYFNVYGR